MEDSEDKVFPDLEMFDVDDLRNNLEDIEEKLRTFSSNSLNGNEISLLNCVMVFSDRIRKLIADQPSDMFVGVRTSEADSNLTFICKVCYIEFSILNRDFEFSFQMHKQSEEHMNAKDIHAIFEDLSDGQDQKEVSKEIIIPSHKIQPILLSRDVVEKHEVRDWLEIRNNGTKHYCSYCECFLPDMSECHLEMHSRGVRHLRNTSIRHLGDCHGVKIRPVSKAAKKKKTRVLRKTEIDPLV